MMNKNKSYLYQLAKDTVYYSISKMIPGLAGVVFVILFFRLIGAEEYGKYSIIFSFANLIAAFSFGWLNQSILRYRSTFTSRIKILSPISLGYIIGFISIIIFVNIISVLQFSITFSKQHVIFLSLSIGIFNIIKSTFQSEEQPNKVILITSFQSILMIISSIIILKTYDNSAEGLILGISLGYLIPILPYSKLFTSNIIAKKNIKKIKSFFNYGAPLSIWLGISLSLNFLDRYFIEYYYGPSLMGSYAGFSEFIIKIFSIFIFPITLAVHPILMNNWNKNKNIYEFFIKIFKASTIQIIICLVMLVPLYLYMDYFFYLIQIMIPELDNSMKEIMIPLFIGGFLWQLALVLHKPLEIEERTLVMVCCIMFSLATNLIGNIYFLPRFGIIATAYTMILSASIYIVSTILYSNSFRNFIER